MQDMTSQSLSVQQQLLSALPCNDSGTRELLEKFAESCQALADQGEHVAVVEALMELNKQLVA